MSDLQRFPITAILLIGSFATFLAEATGRSVEHLRLLPGTEMSEPWRFVTTVFVHGGVLHLLFNALWTWELGRAIERRIGMPWMLALTLLGALVPTGMEVAVAGYPVGLSGVVFAYAFFAFARGQYDPSFAEVMDGMRIRFFVAWFFICILLTETGMMRIANVAHFGGGLIGFAIGSRIRWLAPAVVALTAIALSVSQPLMGDARGDAQHLRVRAYRALEAGDDEAAITLYERVFASGVHRAGSWKNYGIALNNVGRIGEALDAWKMALDIDPQIFDPETAKEITEKYERRRAGRR
ncbi:MAG: rhomboid family intramembrane serine protease [Planctomycetota bacterium]